MTPAEAAGAALRSLEPDETGALPGNPLKEWWPAALRAMADRFGPAYDDRFSATCRFLGRDDRTGAALALSGLNCHPAVVLALMEATL